MKASADDGGGPTRISRVSKIASWFRTNGPRSYIGLGFSVLALAAIAGTLIVGAANTPGSNEPSGHSGVTSDGNEDKSSPPTTELVIAIVPELVGLLIEDARPLLEAEGLRAAARSTFDVSPRGTILTQDPNPGEQLNIQQPVIVIISSGPKPENSPNAETSNDSSSSATPTSLVTPQAVTKVNQGYSRFTVVIDPGHQRKGNSDKEPIGPDSSTSKAKVSQGATGVSTGIPEYQLTLKLAHGLKAALESEGIMVVLTRATHDVDISNSERAIVGNDNSADLAIRIHADGSDDPSVKGISTLYPGVNEWTASIHADSKTAAQLLQDSIVASTGRQDRGLSPRTDITGFNWSEVPVVLAELGFLSNASEDVLINSEAEQQLLVEGLKQGVLAFLDLQ